MQRGKDGECLRQGHIVACPVFPDKGIVIRQPMRLAQRLTNFFTPGFGVFRKAVELDLKMINALHPVGCDQMIQQIKLRAFDGMPQSLIDGVRIETDGHKATHRTLCASAPGHLAHACGPLCGTPT